jgi:GT2 family glycosyltransferase
MIKSTKKIAVVIINYNGKDLLKKFLPSVVKYSDKNISEIFIIDNNSIDGSINFIKKKYSSINIIQNDKNYGYAKGYNIGLDKIQSEYLVLLNNDVQVTKNWLNPMLKGLEENKEIGSCQPKILSYEKKNYFEYAGASGGYLDYLSYPFCRGRIFNYTEKDNGQYDNIKEIFWSSGACMMIRNKIFREVGGFDETFFAHMEEIDLCWRIKGLNYSNFCFPESKVYHLGGGTLQYENPKKTYLNFRNNLIMMLKNESQIKLIFKLPIRLIFDLFASIYLLVSKKSVNQLISVLKAYLFIILRIPYYYIRKRNTVIRKSFEDRISIPIKYYLQGKKRYIDL